MTEMPIYDCLIAGAGPTGLAMAAALKQRRVSYCLCGSLPHDGLNSPDLRTAALFSGSIGLVIVMLGATGWMTTARLVRGQVLSLKSQDFVRAAEALGAGDRRIVFRHLLPNTLTVIIVSATLQIGAIILVEAALSFLGLGVPPPTPSWGQMVFEGREALLAAWWVSAFPGLIIAVTVIGYNLLGDGLRDAFDPRQYA